MMAQVIQLVKYGEATSSFSFTEMEIGNPQKEEVQIEVERFGLNYADVQARKGVYREAPPLPCVLGYEVVGKVVKIGGDISSDWLGKRVVAFTRFGGYSQLVNTNIDGVVVIDNYDGNQALCLATQYVTAYYMSHIATSSFQGDNILIHAAAGGVGTALIQLLKDKNVNIIAKIGDDSKKAYLKDLGIQHIVNYKKQDYAKEVKKIIGGNKLNLSFNPTGGSTYKKDWKLLQPTGKLVLFGGSELSAKYGVLSQLNFLRKMGVLLPIVTMMQSKSLIGLNMLRVAEYQPKVLQFCLQEVVRKAKEGQLQPQIGGEFKATDIEKAHEILGSGKTVGKIVCVW